MRLLTEEEYGKLIAESPELTRKSIRKSSKRAQLLSFIVSDAKAAVLEDTPTHLTTWRSTFAYLKNTGIVPADVNIRFKQMDGKAYAFKL